MDNKLGFKKKKKKKKERSVFAVEGVSGLLFLVRSVDGRSHSFSS
jgi:adenylate cyclase class IV